MRKKTQLLQEEEESEINLTPMLDVVFIMLIFFIVTASFIKEAGIQVSRPDAFTADKQENAAILVAISPNDEIWIDRREVEPKNLRTHIERLHAENPKGALVIQADMGVDQRDVGCRYGGCQAGRRRERCYRDRF